MKKAMLLTLLVLLSGAGLRGADFWKERDYKQWKPKEVHKMLTKSPWSQNVSLYPKRRMEGFGDFEGTTQEPGSQSNPDQSSGSEGGLGGATGPTGGSSGGFGGGAGGPGLSSSGLGGGQQGAGRQGPPPIKVNVRWASALPVKQAIVRSRYRGDFQESATDKQLLNLKDEQYVVMLSGLPSRMARALSNTDRIKQMTALHRKRKDPIAAASVELLPRDQSLEIFLFFPRTEAIALEDKDVELRSQLGPFKIKRKFRLKKMVFQDKLEL